MHTVVLEALNKFADPRFMDLDTFRDQTIVLVSVLDADEPPEFRPPSGLLEVQEDALVGSLVGVVTAVDPDAASRPIRSVRSFPPSGRRAGGARREGGAGGPPPVPDMDLVKGEWPAGLDSRSKAGQMAGTCPLQRTWWSVVPGLTWLFCVVWGLDAPIQSPGLQGPKRGVG